MLGIKVLYFEHGASRTHGLGMPILPAYERENSARLISGLIPEFPAVARDYEMRGARGKL